MGGHAPYVVKFTKIQLKIQHYEVTAVTFLTGPTSAFRGRTFFSVNINIYEL